MCGDSSGAGSIGGSGTYIQKSSGSVRRAPRRGGAVRCVVCPILRSDMEAHVPRPKAASDSPAAQACIQSSRVGAGLSAGSKWHAGSRGGDARLEPLLDRCRRVSEWNRRAPSHGGTPGRMRLGLTFARLARIAEQHLCPGHVEHGVRDVGCMGAGGLRSVKLLLSSIDVVPRGIIGVRGKQCTHRSHWTCRAS